MFFIHLVHLRELVLSFPVNTYPVELEPKIFGPRTNFPQYWL